MLRALINSQIWISRRFEALLPRRYTVDGNTDFVKSFAPKHFVSHAKVYDIGSGRHPLLSAETKQQLGVTLVGLDIDPDELAAAPAGTYDEAICSDVTKFRGQGDGDLVICQALLEHVNGTEKAFAAIASILKPGGKAIIFVPSRNAAFARLNLLLPEGLKRKILFAIFPQAREGQGFKSFYDRCTPREFARLAEQNGLQVLEVCTYFSSAYFMFFFPLHVLWRVWVIAFRAIARDQAAETFCMAVRKQ